ncbi:MAG: phytase [Acidobacteria bacterium]|nr:phytase [Acidobacteriota bacterium]
MTRCVRVAVMVASASVLTAGCGQPDTAQSVSGAVVGVRPAVETAPVSTDADDPAVWINPVDPARSLIIGTDKTEAAGGLYVFDLAGAVRQIVSPLDRPNNVDVEYGLLVGGVRVDVAVTTERKQQRLRVFRIDAGETPLTEISADGGIRVLDDAVGEAAEPMGIALYRRAFDQEVFAIIAPKTGGTSNYLAQYRLHDDGTGRVTGTFVRRFGNFSRIGAEPGEVGEIEALVVDDALGFVYAADERFGIRKYHADPDHPDAAVELAVIGQDGYQADREGLAIFAGPDGTGYLVSVDQIEGGSRLRYYRREGTATNPHDHSEVVREVVTSADSTDGLEVISVPLPGFPDGPVVMMNSIGRNFHLYRWSDLQR